MIEKKKYLEHRIPQQMLDLFRKQAEQKIEAEGWAKSGRKVEVKVDNFVHCWITEEAFKQILMNEKVWFRYRGLYFGDAAGAGADFIVKIEGKEASIGLRSIAPESLTIWKTVAYPEDRFQKEPEKIADYHLVCNHDHGRARFLGLIAKEQLLDALKKSPRLYSPKNQEYFRVVKVDYFRFSLLQELLQKMEKI